LWNNNGLFDYPANTIASRRERYQQYFEQLRCIYRRLDELFDQMRAAGIYDNSIILLHGDHGSRIVMTAPIPINQQALGKQDLVDGFSSLFAMKLPGKPGGYDKSPWPLEQLLARFVYEAGLTPNNLLPGKAEPFVYLIADEKQEVSRIPYVPSD
jgi:arylsulfatase A-like enzyme